MKNPKTIIFFLVFVVFFTAELNSQTKKKDLSKFFLKFQTGFSFLSPASQGKDLLTFVQSNISLGKSEFIFGYQFLNHHNISLSLGKDNFMEEYDVYSGTLENPVFVQTSLRKIETYWLGFYYEYRFNHKKTSPHLGIGTGLNDDRKILFFYSGINISFLDPLSFSFNLRYSKLFKTNNTKWFAKSIGSQIGVDFGILYEF